MIVFGLSVVRVRLNGEAVDGGPATVSASSCTGADLMIHGHTFSPGSEAWPNP
jgi:hypothetical protein